MPAIAANDDYPDAIVISQRLDALDQRLDHLAVIGVVHPRPVEAQRGDAARVGLSEDNVFSHDFVRSSSSCVSGPAAQMCNQ